MGLLDQFAGLGNLDEHQTQGLLAAAAQMLQQSGPSLRPTSFGQVLGGGLAGYQAGSQASRQRKLEDEQARQLAEMRGLQIQEAQGGIAARDAARERDMKLQGLRQEFAQGGGAQAPEAPPELGSQPMASMPGQPQPAAAKPQSAYERQMAYANFLISKGEAQEAMAVAKEAQALRPKVKGWEKVRQGDKVMYAPFYEDGTNGAPVPLEVAEKLEFRDAGGSVEALNPYSGVTERSIRKTIDPSAQLSANVQMRGQNMTDARARDFNEVSAQANGLKLAEKMETAKMTKASQVASFDTMLDTLERLSVHPGLPRSVGLYSITPTKPGSDSANFQAELETFQSQAFIPMVAQLKGMGALSDAEGKKLTAAVGALNPAMSEQAFKASLGRIMKDMDAARERVAGAPRATTAPTPNASTASIPQGAVNMLRMNPKLRDQFDAKYGAGAADSVLGK